jgi:hypothetical protein
MMQCTAGIDPYHIYYSVVFYDVTCVKGYVT